MHKTALAKTRKSRVNQVRYQLFHPSNYLSIHNYVSYVPVGNAVEKLKKWQLQGAEILYLSSHKTKKDVEKDRLVLEKFNFPRGKILYRENSKSYKDIVEEIVPDVLVEDDCESIGGAKEMVMTFVSPKIKKKIKSVTIREFGGIDHLPDNLNELFRY